VDSLTLPLLMVASLVNLTSASSLLSKEAVPFQYEWHNQEGQWFRSYGNELWEFDENGLMRKRFASINDLAIAENERKIF
jgi:nuclear transport factor 2 (NTF2) superfamily protein